MRPFYHPSRFIEFFRRTEGLPGLTTFLSMVYLLAVIPHLLSEAGIPLSHSMLMVGLLAALSSLIAGWLSNTPIVFAPGLGLLSFFVFVVVGHEAIPVKQAFGCVLIANLLLILVSFTPIRRWILNAIPPSLGAAITAGIGFFLGMLALHTAHVITANQETLVSLGSLDSRQILFFFIGFFVIVILEARQIKGALLWGMLLVSILAWCFGSAPFHGLISTPVFPTHLSMMISFSGISSPDRWMTILTFFLIGLFDSTGCMLGLLKQLPESRDGLSSINRLLRTESVSSTIGSLIGLTTFSPLLESSAGIAAGGGTGKTACWVGVLLLGSLFFTPLTESIPMMAVSAVLFYVACLMLKSIAQLQWESFGDSIPGLVTFLTIPLTFSISDGVGMGMLSYVILNVALKRPVTSGMWVIAAIFGFYFFL